MVMPPVQHLLSKPEKRLPPHPLFYCSVVIPKYIVSSQEYKQSLLAAAVKNNLIMYMLRFNCFVAVACNLTLQGIDHSYLKKLQKW